MVMTLVKSLTDDSSILDKILSNVVSAAKLLSNNKVVLSPGGWVEIFSELVFKIAAEAKKDTPWENFDE